MWLDNLKKMKEQSGMTTKEISKQSGIPEPTLEKLFSGATKDPKLPTMQKLVHFLGYTLDDLDNSQRTKKAPSTAEAVQGEELRTEEELNELFDFMQKGLVSLGLIRSGQDITERQADILIGVCKILRAAFEN